MTIWDLFSIAVQRWRLTLCCLLLTGLAVYWTETSPPVHYARVSVVLLPPVSAHANGYASRSESLVYLAGAVARATREAGDGADAASASVTLVGKGYREGSTVQQPDVGGQWQYRFDAPVLDVQAVGPTRAAVEVEMASALGRVESTLSAFQDTQSVADASRVRTRLNPAAVQYYEEDGSRVRAASASILTGLIVTLGVVGGLGPKSQRRGDQEVLLVSSLAHTGS
ncbi:MAG: hypothetical protein JWQ59_36 [Cryobacterium sp.]|jgi:hypothetical protein|nr:hypothetical protein [Cryobacterium sp.]